MAGLTSVSVALSQIIKLRCKTIDTALEHVAIIIPLMVMITLLNNPNVSNRADSQRNADRPQIYCGSACICERLLCCQTMLEKWQLSRFGWRELRWQVH